MRKKLRKKLRKELRGAGRYAAKILRRGIVRDALELILIVAIIYFGANGVLVLALRTDTPWMAVTSPSMKHDGEGWREYFENENVRRQLLLQAGLSGEVDTFDTSKFPLQGGFERGDMLIIRGVNSEAEIKIGDVIVFEVPGRLPFVHRVIKRSEDGKTKFTTKGDGNRDILQVEKSIELEQIKGKVIFVIPKIGHLSLWFHGE